jgi:hypothetical protein
MDPNAIFFEFADEFSAHQAYDTLTELNYSAVLHDNASQPSLHLHIENSDLASALEITQSHGGRLVEQPSALTEEQANNEAYAMEDIPIPAHMVNEDWSENYATGAISNNDLPEDEEHRLDISESTLDFMSGDVHA